MGEIKARYKAILQLQQSLRPSCYFVFVWCCGKILFVYLCQVA